MAAVYEVRIYSQAGAERERLTGQGGDGRTNVNAGWTELSYAKGVNEVGNGAFTLHADSGAMSALATDGEPILDAQVEFWRYDSANSIAPYCDFFGFQRDRHYDTDENGITTYTAILAEQNDLLTRSIINYPANTANRSLFSAVATETILKTLVTRNATSSGTTGDGRSFNVDSWGAFVSVAADTAAGTSQTKACFGENLFGVLQDVGNAGGLDFWLTKTGARTWQFRTGTLLGNDRSSGSGAVTFALQFDNMRGASLQSNRRAERTVCIVGGQGVDAARAMRRRTGANYDATVNSYETFHNGSRYSTNAGLDSAGDERLEELRARDSLSFQPIQVPSTLYGKHYFLGDKVLAYYLGKSYTPQIRGVQVSVSARNSLIEDIQVTAADA